MEKLFRIQRLQHNVRKLFYLTASSQDHSFKYCGKIYLLLNSSETELFSKAKKNQSPIHLSIQRSIHTVKTGFSLPHAEVFGSHQMNIKVKRYGT